MTSGSAPPTTLPPVNHVPCARSSTSASTFGRSMSYSATVRAEPRMSAAYATLTPTLPAPTTVSREFSILAMRPR